MRKKNLPWIYLVFNWEVLIACLPSAAAACAAVKFMSRCWEPPFSEGSVKVFRVRPSADLSETESEDVTGSILRTVYSMRKDADPINDEAVINLWKAKEALPF